MTIAVCYMCGELKFGAFNSCGKCGGSPKTEDDFALSLAMTDHYFDKPTLEKMGADLKNGKPPHLDPKTREQLISELRKFSGLFGIPDRKPSKPWWKFW